MAKQVMIVGCGRVGGILAEMLATQGEQVTILDINPDTFRRLRGATQVQPLVADGTSIEELRRVGIEQTDVFLAVTSKDTVNILAAQTAQVTFRVPTVLCRINDPLRQEIYAKLGLKTVSTTQLTAKLLLEAMVK